MIKTDKKKVGDKGEDIACEYLVSKGYKILGKNWKIKFGEIDIICRKRWGLTVNPFSVAGKTIRFVEVKALSHVSGSFSPEQRANWKKQ
ncbi:MAG: YraN family protein, partial [bacterium]